MALLKILITEAAINPEQWERVTASLGNQLGSDSALPISPTATSWWVER